MKSKLSFLARSVIVICMLVVGCSQAWAWSDFALIGNFSSDSWTPIYLSTKVNDNHFTGTIDASSWDKENISFKLYNEENSGSTTNYWGNGGSYDFTSNQSLTIVSNNNGGDMTFKHNSAYSSYTVDAQYSDNKWSVTITGVSSETKYTINITNGAGGTVSPFGDQQVGATGINVTATPSIGYKFKNWTVEGGASVTTTSATTKLTATAAGSLKANFEEVTPLTIYLQNDGNWTTPITAYVYNENSVPTIKNAEWPGVEMTSLGNGRFSYTITNEALFDGQVIFVGSGSRYPVDGQPGLAIENKSKVFNTSGNTWGLAGPTVTFTPAAGSYTDAKSLQVTLSGEADAKTYTCIVTKGGSQVATKSIDMSTTSVTEPLYNANSNGTYVVTVKNSNGEILATATYTIAIDTKYLVTISAGTGGSVSNAGDQQIGLTGLEITATPSTGYVFSSWTTTGGAAVSGSSATVTVTATGNGTVRANFTETNDIYVYLTNDDNWSGDMYAYFFDGNGNQASAWPGTMMTADATYGYKAIVPETFKNGYVIFNNGNGNGKQFPFDGYSGLAIRRTSHVFNNRSTVSGSNPVHNWQQVGRSATRPGYNSVTIYAYINNDMAWYPNKENDGQNGLLEEGTNFYIYAYVNPNKNSYHAFGTGDVRLTDNNYDPKYGQTAGTKNNSYGDGADELVYPVGYSGSSNLRYAKFVLYYPEEYEGKTAFYTINNGSLGTGQKYVDGNYQVRQLFDRSHYHLGDTYKGTPYYYYLPALKLENGSSQSLRLGFANSFMHQTRSGGGLNVENYQIEDGSSTPGESQVLFESIIIDDDYKNGNVYYNNPASGTKINYWTEGTTHNVNFYRPLKNNGAYQTICLPFDVTETEVQSLFGNGTDEVRLYTVTKVNASDIHVTAARGIKAGACYFMLPTIENHSWLADAANGDAIKFNAKEMKYAYNYIASEDDCSYTDSENQNQTFTMHGCFTPATLTSRKDRFVSCKRDDNGNVTVSYMQAYYDKQVIRGTRCWFTDSADMVVLQKSDGTIVEETTNSAKAVKRFIIDGIEEDIVTGLVQYENTIIPVRDRRIYNLSGQYVGNSLEKLAKGLYIIDGKKIFIK